MVFELEGGRRNRRRKGKNKTKALKRSRAKGGSFIADASVPAGLFLLHNFLKKKKSKKSSKKSLKNRTRRRK